MIGTGFPVSPPTAITGSQNGVRLRRPGDPTQVPDPTGGDEQT